MTPEPGTRVNQLTNLGQGLAVGCLALGVTAITRTKMTIEFAFGHAWRPWLYSRRFPQVRADRRNDIYFEIIGRSERRQGATIAAWDLHGEVGVEPYLKGAWTLDDAQDLMPTYTGVPWSGWLDLAERFVGDLGDDQVVRG
ncbi:MAG: hypothetical protein IR158_04255 [Cellulomonas sp.]|jgi:hypothetical protein|uniref:hypothetical protein n=1 Tax=Cellulomonas sp. TaxID=40001 RepID=UPI0019EBA8DB|nr:hypothetical protein [Cellulomonas sp.]MBF0686965.1 hypothetical protein [Cellulomonas sp.]